MKTKRRIVRHFIGNWKLEIRNSAKLTWLILPSVAHAGVISDAPRVADVLANALKLLLSIFGPLAIICLVIAGVLYITAGGSESQIDRAKKMTFYGVVGIVIALGCLIILKNIARILSG